MSLFNVRSCTSLIPIPPTTQYIDILAIVDMHGCNIVPALMGMESSLHNLMSSSWVAHLKLGGVRDGRRGEEAETFHLIVQTTVGRPGEEEGGEGEGGRREGKGRGEERFHQ